MSTVPAPTGVRRGARSLDGLRAGIRRPAVLAGVLSAYAGALHLYVVPVHLRAWWGYGAFFLAVGIVQVLHGLVVARRPGTALALAGIVGNVAVVGIYVLSRTNGVPIGPVHSGHRLERAGVLDLTATAVEVALIAVLVTLLPARTGRITINVLLMTGVGLWALRLSGLLA
jgi:hypothetical protein